MVEPGTLGRKKTPKRKDLLTEEQRVALQAFYLRAAQHDRDFVADGGALTYAADSNTIIFLCDPSGIGKSNARLQGAVAIFEDDPDAQIDVLSHALADYISEELSPGEPILIPAPHDAEIYEWQRNLTNSVSKHVDVGGHDLQSQASQLARRLNNINSLADDAENIPLKLAQLSLLREGSQSLRRLKDLIERKRILIVATDKDVLIEPLKSAVEPNDGRSNKRWLMEMVQERVWFQTIASLLPYLNMRRIQLRASAFNKVQRWDVRLQRMSGGRRKLVFLSLYTRLFDSVANGFSKGVVQEYQRSSVDFLRNHVRHPRGLLPFVPMLQNGGVEIEDFATVGSYGHFFDLWARWSRGTEVDRQKELTRKVKNSWTSYLNMAALRFKPSDKYFDGSEDWQKMSHEQFLEWQKRLQDEIELRASEYWEDAFYFATQGVVVFGKSSDTRRNPRFGPPLFLSSWKNSADFIDKMMVWTTSTKFDYDKYKSGIDGLKRELSKSEDQTEFRYAYYLAHAALFAGRGEWSVAAKVAAHARLKISVGDRVAGKANGREAYYLEAFCRRHAARRPEDLIPLEPLLKHAVEIAKAESRSIDSAAFDCIPVRFDVELLALEFTTLLFSEYLSEEKADTEDVKAIFQQMVSLLGKVWSQFEAANNRYHAETKKREAGRRLETIAKLALRLSANILVMPFDFPELSFPVSERLTARKYVDQMRQTVASTSRDRDEMDISAFVEFVLSCSDAQIGSTAYIRESSKKEILNRWDRQNLAEIATFPYEVGPNGRLLKMRSIVLGSA